jgi:hypothetical protein
MRFYSWLKQFACETASTMLLERAQENFFLRAARV